MLAALFAAALAVAMGLRGGKSPPNPGADGSMLHAWRRDMELAGLESRDARRRFMTIAVASPLALAALAAWWAWSPGADGVAVALMAGMGGCVGWWLP
ncbi:MAG: hypothetical protein ACKPEA_08135, partial [Planctomycetota bacterium]